MSRRLTTHQSVHAPPGWTERRARWAVTAYFVVAGFGLSTWTARIPAIKARLGLDDAQVSLALFAVVAGAVTAMQFAGRLADRVGSATVMLPAGLLLSLSLIIPGFAGSLPVLLIGLVLFGAGHGAVDVSMNSHAVRVERRYHRPIMSTFHATFSLGGLLGSGAGALAARIGLGAGAHLTLVAGMLALLALIGRPALLSTGTPAAPAARPTRGGRGIPAAILFLGMLGFFCSLGEGAMTDWSALYMHDTLHTSTALAPVGFAVFSATMALFRFLGDALALRFGPVKLVRGCGVIAGIGLGAALVLHHPIAALIGFGLFGVGLSCIVPQVFSAAGNRDPQRSGRDLAQVSTLGYGGLLTGPVIIGMVAHWFGLSVGLGVPAVLALFVAASAGAVRPRKPAGE